MSDQESSKRLSALLAILAFLIFLQLFHSCYSDLSYIRSAIHEGQVWRMLTGQWVHSNGYHLFGNAVLMLLLNSFDESHLTHRLPALMLLSCTISVGIYIFYPGLEHYLGLSGVLHGYALILLCENLSTSFKLVCIGIFVLIAKLWAEQLGVYPHQSTARLIEVRVATEAHLLGGCAGALYCIAAKTRSKQRKENR